MMSGASFAAILVASVVAASVLSTIVSTSSMSSWASLNAATTSCSVAICSSFSPVPRPTNHSISTASPVAADVEGASDGVADEPLDGGNVAPDGVAAAPVHAAVARTRAAAAPPNLHVARLRRSMVLLLS
jgi:hypothetical protein